MNIFLKQGKGFDEPTDLLVIPHYKGESFNHLKPLDMALNGQFLSFIKQEGFEGSLGEWTVLPTYGHIKARRVALIGLGEKNKFAVDDVRKIFAQTIKRGREGKAKRMTIVLPSMNLLSRELGSALAEGLLLGAYRFYQYKGKVHAEDNKKKVEVESVTIIIQDASKRLAIEKGVELGQAFARATMVTRDLVNTPSSDMTPIELVNAAKQCVTRGSGISIKLLDQRAMEKLGMRAALAVAKGSHHPAMGAHLIYRPKQKSKKKIVIIGKAVTFDSGGLSLKPADGMMTMKCDMAGAATVIGLFHALPTIVPNVEVHGIFLAVENMPSGSAYRPGDVVKAMNGVTIEVLNTDAEGRVTLADALSYGEKLKPDVMIDLATLTGACVVALGEEIAGCMGNDRKLLDKLQEAAKGAGEELWELPFYQPYKEHVKSKVADIKNIGNGRWGGALTAGLFLSYFVGKTPWAHVDIAGPAFAEKEARPDQQLGGTGYGVRTLIRYLQGLG